MEGERRGVVVERVHSCREVRRVGGEGGWVQVTETFDEVRIASRGFGILDVGYKSEVSCGGLWMAIGYQGLLTVFVRMHLTEVVSTG